MITVLFVSSFQYSGSTLASFLLNSHPKVATIGHTSGWPFAADEVYYCSCGEPLTQCPFYHLVRIAHEKAQSPFYPNNFKSSEHHMLGNDMRLGSSTIKFDQCWRRALSESDIQQASPRWPKRWTDTFM